MRAVEREPERVVGVQRGERVQREVALRERELELDGRFADAEGRAPVPPIDLGRIEPPERDVVAREERLEHVGACGHDRGSSCGQRSDRLRVRLRHAFDRAEKLEVLGPDVRNDDDVGLRDPAERSDLAEPAHPHLGDEHARLRLEPADGERQADLVVQASVGPDRGHLRGAERGEDVLRRRLARRADHGDDPCVALRADERGERGQCGLLVVRNERRGAARSRVADEVDPGVERDEEVARADLA